MPKLMLVEDDNNLREIYEARLQAEGYDIVTAHDGEEALVVAKAEQPELIISDVMMPKISGFEMLDILRNTDGLKDVKIIMLTALGQSDDQQRADRLGADAYLVKSQVTLEDIVKVAERLLGGEETEEAPAEAEPVAPAVPEQTVTPDPALATAAAAPVAAAIPEPAPAPQPTPEVAMPQPMAMPEPVAAPAPVVVPAAEPAAALPEPPVVPEPPQAPEPAPAPSPVVAPEPQVELPAPQAQPEPVTQDQQEPAMAFEMTPVPENQLAQSAPDAMPTSEEAASVQAQIEQFANDVPATAPEVDPASSVQQPPAEDSVPVEEPTALPSPAPAPEAPEQYLTTAAPDLTSAVPQPAPAPQSAGNDDVLATAIESLTGVPASPAPDQMAGAVTATAPGPNAPAKGGERVIAPLATPSKPDINTLLSMEQAKEQAPGTTIAVPEGSTTPVVQPTAPQNNTPPAPQNAPGEVIDPNSIAL